MADTKLKAKDGGYVGVDGARLMLRNADGTPNTSATGLAPDSNGIYTVTTALDGGVTGATLSGLAQTIARVWGNNEIADITVGKAQPSVAFTTNFLNHIILNKVLGRKDYGDGAFGIDSLPQNIAIDIISNVVNGGEVHICFFTGKMTSGDINLATNNENENRTTDALTYTPFAGGSDNTIGRFYYVADATDSATALARIDKEIFDVAQTSTSTGE